MQFITAETPKNKDTFFTFFLEVQVEPSPGLHGYYPPQIMYLPNENIAVQSNM